jgi:hypothetical protein
VTSESLWSRYPESETIEAFVAIEDSLVSLIEKDNWALIKERKVDEAVGTDGSVDVFGSPFGVPGHSSVCEAPSHLRHIVLVTIQS